MHRRLLNAALFASFVALVWLANYLTSEYGFVDLGPWTFTAGTYAAGLTFGVRDALQEAGGRLIVIVAIAVGAGLSYIVAPSLAVASGVAFLLAESADFLVYTPLRERRWALAVVLSNLVGAIVDTIIFLWIAFGWSKVTETAVSGQLAGKALMILPAMALVAGVRAYLRPADEEDEAEVEPVPA